MRASRCSPRGGRRCTGPLLAAKTAGHSHVIVDGALIYTDRISTPGPTRGVDLRCSGKHHHHGGNIQVVFAPDGWPQWTSGVRPGRERDTSAARADPDLLARITDWVSDGAFALSDLGYEGEPDTFTIPFKKPKTDNSPSTNRPTTPSTAPCAASASTPTPFSKSLTKPYAATAGRPCRLGDITTAALILLHHEHGRTT
jgi:DDE superfamily endonuclease